MLALIYSLSGTSIVLTATHQQCARHVYTGAGQTISTYLSLTMAEVVYNNYNTARVG